MARLIKIVIVALVIYAAWHGVSAQWDHFAFQDAVRQLAEFGEDRGDDALRAGVIAEGARIGVLIEPERVVITRTADHLYLNIAYTRPVQVLPGYRYNWTFTAKVERWYIPGGRIR